MWWVGDKQIRHAEGAWVQNLFNGYWEGIRLIGYVGERERERGRDRKREERGKGEEDAFSEKDWIEKIKGSYVLAQVYQRPN